ncbi:hypothetical protein GH714_000851 [Hevea brasiliensis]|uniref:Derlin n=1 Tax=Hevea brasiliensis TaxID=3981 RepID=A0A6A6LU85_HEVBR|nr:hypothetical protein GH714_000851 [Hevea brasiliensis]
MAGVCLVAVKNWGQGEEVKSGMGGAFWSSEIRNVFEKREEEDGCGYGDDNGCWLGFIVIGENRLLRAQNMLLAMTEIADWGWVHTSHIISPHNLYLHPTLVVKHYQFWRLITNFLYFRKMDLDFLFHMFFLARYCKLLEENSFRGRTADFFYMLLFGATVLTGIVLLGGMIPYLSESFAKIIFLSNSLTFMMVYVWSKQNPFIHMSFLGLFTFTAAYLPWAS